MSNEPDVGYATGVRTSVSSSSTNPLRAATNARNVAMNSDEIASIFATMGAVQAKTVPRLSFQHLVQDRPDLLERWRMKPFSFAKHVC